MIRAVLTKHLRRSTGYRSNWHDSLSYRNVYVTDSNLDYINWIKSKPADDGSQIKHPSSKHMVYNYANYVHQHGSYNFNNLGEYVLDVSACQASGTTAKAEAEADSQLGPASVPQKHELLLWPDALHLKNLTTVDIPILGKLLLKDSKLEKDSLVTQLNPSALVQDITEPTVLFGVCNLYTLEHAQRIQQWFEQAISTKHPDQKVNFFITSTTKRPTERIARVLVLPTNKQYEEVNSLRKVEQIVDDMKI